MFARILFSLNNPFETRLDAVEFLAMSELLNTRVSYRAVYGRS